MLLFSHYWYFCLFTYVLWSTSVTNYSPGMMVIRLPIRSENDPTYYRVWWVYFCWNVSFTSRQDRISNRITPSLEIFKTFIYIHLTLCGPIKFIHNMFWWPRVDIRPQRVNAIGIISHANLLNYTVQTALCIYFQVKESNTYLLPFCITSFNVFELKMQLSSFIEKMNSANGSDSFKNLFNYDIEFKFVKNLSLVCFTCLRLIFEGLGTWLDYVILMSASYF